jgi:RNA polymerase sigma-54 factor
MILKDVANDIGMHESTISRVTTNKFVHTPVGIFELKYFFNSSINAADGTDSLASEAVKEKIRQMIQREDPKNPFRIKKLWNYFEPKILISLDALSLNTETC